MKISQQPTDHILVKAHCNSEWDNCDFAIVSCGREWMEQMEKRLNAIRPFKNDSDFSCLQYYDYGASFYTSCPDGEEAPLPEDRAWAFVDLDEGEEEEFSVPESRLNCYMLDIDKNGRGAYKAYGKNTNYEFFTDDLPLSTIIENIRQHIKS